MITAKEMTLKIFSDCFSNALHVAPKPMIYVWGEQRGMLSSVTYIFLNKNCSDTIKANYIMQQ